MTADKNSFASKEDSDLFLPVAEAKSVAIRQGVAYWDSLRGSRRFPARVQLSLRGLGRLAKHAVIIRVVDGGTDYDFRFVGLEPSLTVGSNFQGRRMNDPDVLAVMSANHRRQLYDRVAQTGEPWLFRVCGRGEAAATLPVGSEAAFLPLGDTDGAVDHLLGFVAFSSGLR